MRIPRFYLASSLRTGDTITLPDTVFRHAVQVLRLKPGDALVLFNGAGGEYRATLREVERRRATALIETFVDNDLESPLRVTLVQAISKGERMDYTLQKAVELGVARIIPVFSERSVVSLPEERLRKRLQHWRGVVGAACGQCGRNRLPEVAEPSVLAEWLGQGEIDGSGLLLQPQAPRGLRSLTLAGSDARVTLLIGPEGGLSDVEAARAERAGFIGIALGPRILRTETAAVTALSALQLLWGDLAGGRPAARAP